MIFETAASNIVERGPDIIHLEQKHMMAKVFRTETNVNLPSNHVFDTRIIEISTHKHLKNNRLIASPYVDQTQPGMQSKLEIDFNIQNQTKKSETESKEFCTSSIFNVVSPRAPLKTVIDLVNNKKGPVVSPLATDWDWLKNVTIKSSLS